VCVRFPRGANLNLWAVKRDDEWWSCGGFRWPGRRLYFELEQDALDVVSQYGGQIVKMEVTECNGE
jgi:hypothetical protein